MGRPRVSDPHFRVLQSKAKYRAAHRTLLAMVERERYYRKKKIKDMIDGQNTIRMLEREEEGIGGQVPSDTQGGNQGS